jgi:RNA polymerase sigma factor (sigma-70 family)
LGSSGDRKLKNKCLILRSSAINIQMHDVSDMELLRNYDRHGSEDAFAELVRRHISLVYSAALRQVGIAAHAEEIAQAVFVILGRKAARLRPDTVLEGWLYETTRLTALSFLRGERRRQWREQEAYMQSSLQESNDDSTWHQLAPLLDEAMSRLGKKDRAAVVLRYFKEKKLGEVAAALQVTEAAAQSRVQRAVEKLHRYFNKRGVSLTTAILAGAISAHAVQAAPVGLAKTVSALAITKGAAASVSTLTLSKGVLKIMAWSNMKTAIVIAAAVLVAAGTTSVVIHHERAQPADRKLTLKIDPEVFMRNVKARAAETMHLPSDSWADIWLDILTMARVDSTLPHETVFNPTEGTIAMVNTSAALEIFRQVVEELNRADGKRNRPPPSFDSRHAILIESYFYKMSSADFEHLNLGAPSARGGTNESAWWMLDSNTIAGLKQSLNGAGLQPFEKPRLQTYPGGMIEFFVGESPLGQGVGFDFLPMRLLKALDEKDVPEDVLDLKAQVSTSLKFTSNPAGDWPVFAGRTNCAIFTRASVVKGHGLLFRAVNPWSSEANNLVVLSEVSVNPLSLRH